jgi:hypothetical protein
MADEARRSGQTWVIGRRVPDDVNHPGFNGGWILPSAGLQTVSL